MASVSMMPDMLFEPVLKPKAQERSGALTWWSVRRVMLPERQEAVSSTSLTSDRAAGCSGQTRGCFKPLPGLLTTVRQHCVLRM